MPVHSPIIGDLITRLVGDYGTFDAVEWQRFTRVIGLSVLFEEMPKKVPAMLCDDTIVVNPLIVTNELDTAWWVFHEAGHWLLHDGDRREWKRIPGGTLVVGKFERQVNEFAARYPRWEAVPPCALRHVGALPFNIDLDVSQYP